MSPLFHLIRRWLLVGEPHAFGKGGVSVCVRARTGVLRNRAWYPISSPGVLIATSNQQTTKRSHRWDNIVHSLAPRYPRQRKRWIALHSVQQSTLQIWLLNPDGPQDSGQERGPRRFEKKKKTGRWTMGEHCGENTVTSITKHDELQKRGGESKSNFWVTLPFSMASHEAVDIIGT